MAAIEWMDGYSFDMVKSVFPDKFKQIFENNDNEKNGNNNNNNNLQAKDKYFYVLVEINSSNN